MHAMFMQLIDWYQRSLADGGYPLIVLLMAIESSVVPLPSELVIPFAAHLAHTQGRMSVAGVVIAGTVGCWVGATVMYWVSRLAGRPLVMRYGRIMATPLEGIARAMAWAGRLRTSRNVVWRLLAVVLTRGLSVIHRLTAILLITPGKVEAAERWSATYGSFSIFFSRVLPVVRHLIGIPAGVVRLDFRHYSIYTLAGSGVWCSVLAWVGLKAGEDEALMRGDLQRVTLWVVGACVILGAIYYFFVHRQMKAAQK